MYEPMDESATSVMAIILMTESNGVPSKIAEMFVDLEEVYFSVKVLTRRLEVLKLPIVEPTGVLALSVLAEGNPGRALLGLIDAYEKADILKPEKINASFVYQEVYPMGFYKEDEFNKRLDARREEKKGKYDFILA